MVCVMPQKSDNDNEQLKLSQDVVCIGDCLNIHSFDYFDNPFDIINFNIEIKKLRIRLFKCFSQYHKSLL